MQEKTANILGSNRLGWGPLNSEQIQEPLDIMVTDPEGVQRAVRNEDWKTRVCREFLEHAKNTNNPEVLYNQIMQAVKTGCAMIALPFGEELASYDPDRLRSTISLGILLSETGQDDKALALYLDYKSKYGDHPAILTNCAKLFKKRGNIDASREVLWESLKLDPNQENAIVWYAGSVSGTIIHYNPYLLDRIKRLKGAWLVYIYQARSKFDQTKPEEAKKIIEDLLESDIYKEAGPTIFKRLAFELVDLSIPKETVSLILSRYDLKSHGLETGLLLIKALSKWNDKKEYEALIRKLYKEVNPTEISKIMLIERDLLKSNKKTKDITSEENPHIDLLMIEKPLWIEGLNYEVFPRESKKSIITVISGICSTDTPKGYVDNEVSEKLERISKIYTLLVGEYLQLTTAAHTNIILPWIQRDRLGTIYISSPSQAENPTGVMQPTEFTETFRSIREVEGQTLPAYSLNMIFEFYNSIKKKEEGWDNKIVLHINLYQEKNWVLLRWYNIVIDLNNPFEKIDEVLGKIQHILKNLLKMEIKPPIEEYDPKNSPDYTSYGENLLNLLKIQCYNNESLVGLKLYDPLHCMEQATKAALKSKHKWLSKKILEATINELHKARPEIVEGFLSSLQTKEKNYMRD